MENNIQAINLSAYQPVEAIEKENRAGWIDYGFSNLFPQHLITLYYNSPIHNALTNSIAYMIEGQGTGTILDNALQGISFDLKLQGSFCAEVIWSMDFTRVVQINHLPFENCRLAYDKDEDDITGIFYSKDWANTRSKKGKPEFIPAFNPSMAQEQPRQVIYAHGMMAGSSYYAKPDYFGALNYVELSYQMGLYHVNNILNGLFPSFIINFLNGIPQKEEREAIRREWETRLSGASNAGKFLMTFNEDPTRAPQIESFPLSDADKQYQFLSEETAKQIMVGHRVVSPLIHGIRDANGFGSNKDEMIVGMEIFNTQVIRPYQRIIEDVFTPILGDVNIQMNSVFEDGVAVDSASPVDVIDIPSTTDPTAPVADAKVSDVTYNGAQIASALEIVANVGLGTLTQEQAIVFLVQFLGLDVDVAKSMFQTGGDAVAKLSAQKKKVVAKKKVAVAENDFSDEQGEEWINVLEQKAEYIDSNEWELVSEEDVTDPQNEMKYTSEFFAKRNKMPTMSDARGEEGSKFGDKGLYKLRYAYSQNISTNNKGEIVTRQFCRKMVQMSQSGAIFRYEDIEKMSENGVNKAFAPEGENSYNLFRYVGGCFCHHFWKRQIYVRKRDTNGRILPNNGLENDKRVGNNPYVPQKGIEGTAPINRPDRGSLKYP
jgi:hypothetical protein